jgi:hypothetical protein
MAVSCPSLPPKILTDEQVRPTGKHRLRMAAEGRHLAACSLYVLLVNIESFLRTSAIFMIARTVLYKARPAILSRTFSEKTDLRTCARVDFDNSSDEVSCPAFLENT